MSDIYHAVYEREEGAWLVEIAEEPRCHSWGRTLVTARRNIRDALALWLESAPEEVHVEDTFRLPPVVRESLADLDLKKAALRDAQFHLSWTVERIAKALVTDLDLSLRDAAQILGMSHQRVHQMLKQT